MSCLFILTRATQRNTVQFDVEREPGDAPAAVIVREERSVSKTAVRNKQTARRG